MWFERNNKKKKMKGDKKSDSSKRVYIADDNNEDLENVTKILTDLGYEVDVLSSEHPQLELMVNNIQEGSLFDDQSKIYCMELTKKFATLTNREKQVVQMLALGVGYSTNKSVAKELNLSHRTVEEYRAEAMRKMQAESFKDLVTMVIICKLFHSQFKTPFADFKNINN